MSTSETITTATLEEGGITVNGTGAVPDSGHVYDIEEQSSNPLDGFKAAGGGWSASNNEFSPTGNVGIAVKAGGTTYWQLFDNKDGKLTAAEGPDASGTGEPPASWGGGF